MITPSDFCDLIAGYTLEYLAEFLQVETRTIIRWKKGTSAVPYSAVLALNIKIHGDVAGMFGEGWKGFNFGPDGKLYPPYFRGGFSPLQIAGMFFEMQELRLLRRENNELKAAIAAHSVESEKQWAKNQVLALFTLDD